MPDTDLQEAEGLEIIPEDVREEGSKRVVTYMLDLYKSHRIDRLYRSKIMVVGYQKVGKTTLLGCLFPMQTHAQLSFLQHTVTSKPVAEYSEKDVYELVASLKLDPSPFVENAVNGEMLVGVSFSFSLFQNRV